MKKKQPGIPEQSLPLNVELPRVGTGEVWEWPFEKGS